MSVERKAGRRSRAKCRSKARALIERSTTSGLGHHEELSGAQDTLLTDLDLERITGRARSTWQKARLTGNGPPFIRLGRLVRYRPSEFSAWLAACPSIRSTSEAARREL